MVEPSLRNLNEGRSAWPTTVRCLPCGSIDIAAGLVHTTLASSATAAPPANALPVAGVCVPIPNAPAYAEPAAAANAAPIDNPIHVRFICFLPQVPCNRSYVKDPGAAIVHEGFGRSAFLVLRCYHTRTALVVDRVISERGLGHLHALVAQRAAVREHFDIDRDRGAADAPGFGIVARQIAQEDGL